MFLLITFNVTVVNTVLCCGLMPKEPRARSRPAGYPLRKRKGAYHHGNLRRALIDAGLALIDREGATALSLRAVAQRVGVSAAAPYRHFPSREALLAAVAEEGFRLLGKELQHAIDAESDPARRLAESGLAYVQYAAAPHPAALCAHVSARSWPIVRPIRPCRRRPTTPRSCSSPRSKSSERRGRCLPERPTTSHSRPGRRFTGSLRW